MRTVIQHPAKLTEAACTQAFISSTTEEPAAHWQAAIVTLINTAVQEKNTVKNVDETILKASNY